MTVARILLNKIKVVEQKYEEKKSPFRKRRKDDELYDVRKKVITNKVKVFNVGKSIMENETDLGWTLNFSV